METLDKKNTLPSGWEVEGFGFLTKGALNRMTKVFYNSVWVRIKGIEEQQLISNVFCPETLSFKFKRIDGVDRALHPALDQWLHGKKTQKTLLRAKFARRN